jgi:hypothetical protein
MSPPLSHETQRWVSILFSPETRAEASRVLSEQCGNNLPFCEKLDQFQMERWRFAALKLGEGSIDKLSRAIELAKLDWRDLLVSAGFGDVDAHIHWAPKSPNE